MLLLGGEMLELGVHEGNICDNGEFKKNAINFCELKHLCK